MEQTKTVGDKKSRQGTAGKRKRVKFTLVQGQAREVAVVGDFNDWNPAAHPMKRDDYGVWKKDVIIPPGEYQYKFLVDGSWSEDPGNELKRPNCFGTYNSLIRLDSP